MNIHRKSVTYLILAVFLATGSLFSVRWVAATDPDRDTVETWEGALRLFGNEPFTRVALITDSGERWFLDMEEDEMNRLWHNRKGRIRITGIPVTKEYAGRTEHHIKVVKYSWIPDNG